MRAPNRLMTNRQSVVTAPAGFSVVGVTAVSGSIDGVTLTMPAGTQTDDICFVLVETNLQAIAVPSGYTEATNSPTSHDQSADQNSTTGQVFYKRLTGGSGTIPALPDAGDHIVAVAIVIRGIKNTGSPLNAATVGGSDLSATISFPSVTPSVANTMILLMGVNGRDGGSAVTAAPTNANLSSLTQQANLNSVAGNGGGVYVMTGLKAAASATGVSNGTIFTSEQVNFTFALEPM